MKLAEVIAAFESVVPLAYQENYDNSGLTVGDPEMEVHAALLCIDVTGDVIREALKTGSDLIISHHPVIFSPLKKITGSDLTERIVALAISHKIALYCAHTNIDNLSDGVNLAICRKLELTKVKVLVPLEGRLRKLVTFVPLSHEEQVRSALFTAGAGHIGNYDSCSFEVTGEGSFRAGKGTDPFVGEPGILHHEKETRIETVFPWQLQQVIINALVKAHPYEEVAYDIYPLDNAYEKAGAGMIGELNEPQDETAFMVRVKEIFGCRVIRHSPLLNKPLHKVAVCGGSGSFLIRRAINAGAELFITGDIKYHQFFEADGKIVVADIGHFESEQFTIEIFYEILTKKLPNFAIRFSSINTSPINYL